MSDQITMSKIVWDELINKLEKQQLETAKLNSIKQKHLWLHTLLTLRYKIEQLENVAQTKCGMEYDEWKTLTRKEKVGKFFLIAEQFGYGNFMNCLSNVTNNHENLASRISKMYDILCARIHRYLESDEISENAFKEDDLLSIAKCLNNHDF